jgi:MarR family transcriptional regulator, transcriptional regulator for hemolysin
LNTNGLDSSLGFLLGVTHRKLATLFQQRLKEFDITTEQWSVLYRIYEKDGLIQKEIAERAGKDKPSTTRILDSLEAKGFIGKKLGEHDRRSFAVFITDKGRVLIEQTASIEKKTIQEAMKGVNEQEEKLLLQLLKQIRTNIEDLSNYE